MVRGGNRPLLIGSDPGHNPTGEPLGLEPRRAAGNRLRKLLGMTDAEYLETFDRVNLFEHERRPWDKREAILQALILEREVGYSVMNKRVLIFLGQRVTEAFRLSYEPFRMHGPRVLVLPHPSGLCRSWNDPANVDRARQLVRGILEKGC